MTVLIPILLAINLIVAVLIILVTLMQRPKQEGLGAAFGGGMTENLFGAQTTNVLVSITRWLGGIFFGVTLLISILYARQSTTKSAVQKELLESPKPTPAAEAPAVPSVPVTPETKTPEAVTPEAPAPTPAPAAPEATPAVEAPAAEAPKEAPTETPAAEAPAAPAETPAATPAP